MLLLSEENEGVADPRNEEHGRLKDPKFPLLHPSHLVAGPEGNFSRGTLYFFFITSGNTNNRGMRVDFSLRAKVALFFHCEVLIGPAFFSSSEFLLQERMAVVNILLVASQLTRLQDYRQYREACNKATAATIRFFELQHSCNILMQLHTLSAVH